MNFVSRAYREVKGYYIPTIWFYLCEFFSKLLYKREFLMKKCKHCHDYRYNHVHGKLQNCEHRTKK